MWKYLLDPSVQALAFVLAVSALGYVVWDFVDDLGAATSRSGVREGRRKSAPPSDPPRRKPSVEPSVEIWTDPAGQSRGRVRRGPCRGQRLEDMSREQCEAQAAFVRNDDPALAAAMDAYLRQRFGHQRRFEPKTEEGFGRADALAELGLREGASEADIQSAYRKLIKSHHPDHGGSHAKAARLNQAKDVLAG